MKPTSVISCTKFSNTTTKLYKNDHNSKSKIALRKVRLKKVDQILLYGSLYFTGIVKCHNVN